MRHPDEKSLVWEIKGVVTGESGDHLLIFPVPEFQFYCLQLSVLDFFLLNLGVGNIPIRHLEKRGTQDNFVGVWIYIDRQRREKLCGNWFLVHLALLWGLLRITKLLLNPYG